MKTTLFAGILSVAPLGAVADPGLAVTFSAGLGGSVSPVYFGSDSYSAGVTGSFALEHLRLGDLEFGSPGPKPDAAGVKPRASFRLVGARTSADHPELAGLDDVDLSVELGGGLGYHARTFSAFADVRYGVFGHQSLVAEFGADAILRPTEDVTFRVGPRALWGAQGYTSTFFGVTPTEAANSAFTAYAPGAGIVSAGIRVGATYQITPDMKLDGSVSWTRLMGDAAGSPIVRAGDSIALSLVLTRRFSFGR